MELNYEQILQLIGAKELDICVLRLRIIELEDKNTQLTEALNSQDSEDNTSGEHD